MAITIQQLAAASYARVVAKTPYNQWSQSTLLNTMEKMGYIKRVSFGNTIEVPLDYRRNPGAKFLTTELETMSTSATEILTAASADFAELSVPVFWSNRTEVANSSENQKVDIVDSLISNAKLSHDDVVEAAFFATSTNGFLGLPTFMQTAGTGTVHGIDSSAETWWRNAAAQYVDETNIEASLDTAWYAASKGTGAPNEANLLVSDGATKALFEGTQSGLNRYDSQVWKAGATKLMFKTAEWVHSQYGTSSIYGLNPKNLHMEVSKEYFRDKRETENITNANGRGFLMYSALQMIATNRSRLFVVYV